MWYPADNRLFLTIGDDHLVKIWGQKGMTVSLDTEKPATIIPAPQPNESDSCECEENGELTIEDSISDIDQ
jgi:hypothetical protein